MSVKYDGKLLFGVGILDMYKCTESLGKYVYIFVYFTEVELAIFKYVKVFVGNEYNENIIKRDYVSIFRMNVARHSFDQVC